MVQHKYYRGYHTGATIKRDPSKKGKFLKGKQVPRQTTKCTSDGHRYHKKECLFSYNGRKSAKKCTTRGKAERRLRIQLSNTVQEEVIALEQ